MRVRRCPVEIEGLIKKAGAFAEPFRVTHGDGFRLKDLDPADTLDFGSEDKPRSKEVLALGIEALGHLQDMLYAQDCWAVLLVFQAMDAAGKDGTIKHVMSGVNPQGCDVVSFKSPSTEDLDVPGKGGEGGSLRGRYRGAQGGQAPPHRLEGGALVRGSRRQQVVHPGPGRGCDHRHARLARSPLSEGHQGEAAGARGREARIAGGQVEAWKEARPYPASPDDPIDRR